MKMPSGANAAAASKCPRPVCPTPSMVFRTSVGEDPAGIHWSESFPKTIPEIATPGKRQSAHLGHLIHREMTTANQVRRQPSNQKIERVIDAELPEARAPSRPLSQNIENPNGDFADWGGSVEHGAASS